MAAFYRTRGLLPPAGLEEETVAATARFFDEALLVSAHASVAPYSLGDAHLLQRATEEVVQYLLDRRLLGHRRRTLELGCGNGHDKYSPLLERTRTHNELYYVGPREKAEFVRMLVQRLGGRKHESVVKNLFRPSYGGNRNCTLMYTLGGFMVSADDDMRPDALIENSVESLAEREISRGKLVKSAGGGFTRRSFDILRAFGDVLGKKVTQIPENYATGEYLVDTAMDLETNATKGIMRENSLFLERGEVSSSAVVKIAQTFRTGTNDIDAIDFVDLFLQDDAAVHLEDLNDLYVLVNFRPAVTNKNWRMDCGVAAYDNRHGLPPFFPTRLRFEDYIYRLWIQREGMVAAHVDAVQNHMKSNYMRNPPAAEVFNEEVCNLINRIVDDVVSEIQGALELWPTLVEICYFQRHTKDLPKVKVANVHLGSG